MKGTKFLVALAVLSASTLASAEIYKWKDANGHVHFSDQPPADAKTNATTLKGGAPVASPAAAPDSDASKPAGPKTWQEKEQEARQRKAEQAAADKKKKDEEDRAADKERYCTSLRNNRAMLQKGGRVGSPNAKGEMELYSDEQMAKKIAELNDKIAKECSK